MKRRAGAHRDLGIRTSVEDVEVPYARTQDIFQIHTSTNAFYSFPREQRASRLCK